MPHDDPPETTKIAELFVGLSKDVFLFLEQQYGFVRHASREEIQSDKTRRMTVLYEKSGTYIQIILDMFVSVAIGRAKDALSFKAPTPWEPGTLDHAFSLVDLITFRTQGAPGAINHLGLDQEGNLESKLTSQAEALKQFGADVLAGDLSVLEDLATINRNKALRFLP